MISKSSIKVIHILSHSPSPVAYESGPDGPPPKTSNVEDRKYAIKINQYPHWVAFTKNDFHTKLAYEIRKTGYSVDQECWRPYAFLDKVHTQKIDGIVHKLFPSTPIKIGRYNLGEWPTELFTHLKKEVATGKVLVHLHGSHSYTINHILLKLNLSNVPVITSQRGSFHPSAWTMGLRAGRYTRTSNGWRSYFIKEKYWQFLKWALEKIAFESVDLFQVMSTKEFELMTNIYGKDKVVLWQDGIDFEKFRPIPKEISKKTIGIKESQKLVLFVGQFTKDKGVENVISAYRYFKSSDRDIIFILIGGHKTDDLYDLVVSSGVSFFHRKTQEELVNYHSAADVHLYLANPYTKIRNFGGISNSNIEALACGTPIFTSILHHFFGSNEERKQLGLDFHPEDNPMERLEYLLNHPHKYLNCRKIARKYYCRKTNAKRTIKIYSELFKKYKIDYEDSNSN